MNIPFHPLLEGAIELHVHSAPSLFPRKQTDWELIEDIKEAKMSGVVLKAHEAQTVDRAALIREKEPQLRVYGGIVCNHFTGGLSPATVDTAIRLGAKIIWMPTFSAEEHQRYFGKKKTKFFNSKKSLKHSYGLEIWDENRSILPEVHEILDLIAEANIILATGHLAAEEVDVLVDAAIEHKVEKILIQHTDLGIARIPHELEKKFVKKGCILEKCYLACSDDFNDIRTEEMAETIKILGADSCVMVTDYGQSHNIPPVRALSRFVDDMLQAGLSDKEITKMIVSNPKQLLGL
ncbi:hypothetical protein M670_00011 [Schinkia azotoformans MEV2011]|uniref:Uncharacterized protein n=1 Tax=Schinkia azotoformans MEV2011 TaxID=1348973 RepID=A0A072NR99_SCHAZ|nr:DUF6282 family protein [Schinkia azotoformans]KEF40001.1 hypothetical protein M670_00011 [Schinkia azotoformans MEV2011]MEC1694697.1 DUF6282 family protein [Schinkia azotoformans]MEC1716941.1 DUF6282 family protein [Schinkia azotoformans]MEC1726380.1 DUF6282 family protein [Schinkia azotoformans]MEC1743223.1 DUF6282 family protein [Schinkia azotoformans]